MPRTASILPHQFTVKLYRLLRYNPEIFHLTKLRNARGYCHDDGSRIELDYRDEIIPTLIHEVLHFHYPDWSESKVRWHETYLINSLSPRQVKNIIKKFSEIL